VAFCSLGWHQNRHTDRIGSVGGEVGEFPTVCALGDVPTGGTARVTGGSLPRRPPFRASTQGNCTTVAIVPGRVSRAGEGEGEKAKNGSFFPLRPRFCVQWVVLSHWEKKRPTPAIFVQSQGEAKKKKRQAGSRTATTPAQKKKEKQIGRSGRPAGALAAATLTSVAALTWRN